MDKAEPHMGWGRAVLIGFAIVAAAAVALVYIPDLLIVRLTGLGRSRRVAIATIWFSVALGALAWTLRRLQAHQEI